jgi:hypothetical protein
MRIVLGEKVHAAEVVAGSESRQCGYGLWKSCSDDGQDIVAKCPAGKGNKAATGRISECRTWEAVEEVARNKRTVSWHRSSHKYYTRRSAGRDFGHRTPQARKVGMVRDFESAEVMRRH